MPKQKSGKVKKDLKEEVVKEYKLITEDEVFARDLKYRNRIMDIKECLHFIDVATAELEDFKISEHLKEKWQKYLRCDELPKPYMPQNVRLFFEKLRYFETENCEKTVNWLLAVDESSILNQNIFRKDLTRNTLLNEVRPEFGKQYERNIDLALKVLKRIEYYLDNSDMTAKASPRMLLDIIDLKLFIQKEIWDFLDRYTYRILSSENAYMNSVDAITAEYLYTAKDFKIHIWTLKDVPILFQYMDIPSICANLHQLNVMLQLPFSILEENLTIRGLHLNFDHFSEHAKSYEQVIDTPVEKVNASIRDLENCLINELSMQTQIEGEVRNDMIQRRLEYEAKMLQYEEDLAKMAKLKKEAAFAGGGGKKYKGKKLKLPKEVPEILSNIYPEIWEDFLEFEQKQFEDFMKHSYDPTVLKLSLDEINLKKYSILGGIYQFYFVGKPIHTDFQSFNMSWHINNGKLSFKDNVLNLRRRLKTASLDAYRRSVIARISTLSDESNKSRASRASISEFIPDTEFDTVETSSYFVISFQLPSELCLWSEPIACYFEADVIGFIEKASTATKSQMPDGKSTTSISSQLSVHSRDRQTSVVSMESKTAAASSKRSTISFHSSIPMVQRVPRESKATQQLLTSTTSEPVSDVIILEDFHLDFPLSKMQIHDLQRHCLPLIISSHKFPKELRAEEVEEIRTKSKGLGDGGTLVRRRLSQDEEQKHEDAAGRAFSFEMQNNPERIFPIFPQNEPLALPYKSETLYETLRNNEPNTFFELIESLETIKRLHTTNFTNILYLPHFKSKIPQLKGTDIPTTGSTSTLQHRVTDKKRSSNWDKKKASLRWSRVFNKMRSSLQIRPSQPSQPFQYDAKVDAPETFKYSHWTTKYIYHSKFDKDQCRITIWTDRLGTFGFAFKRYVHFPFRFWSIQPSAENPNHEIVFTLETQYVRCVIFVTAQGYRGYVTDLTKKFVRNRPMFLVIEEPISDMKELKKRFRDKNINIFSEQDARFYIENGYFSEKHLAAELHTYACMTLHGGNMKFMYSDWNRLAQRRDIILRFADYKEPEEEMTTVRITPENATFVEVKELCSDDLDVVKLEYTPTWRNIEFYADLNKLILSVHPMAADTLIKDANLICALKELLCAIRPLSYS